MIAITVSLRFKVLPSAAEDNSSKLHKCATTFPGTTSTKASTIRKILVGSHEAVCLTLRTLFDYLDFSKIHIIKYPLISVSLYNSCLFPYSFLFPSASSHTRTTLLEHKRVDPWLGCPEWSPKGPERPRKGPKGEPALD